MEHVTLRNGTVLLSTTVQKLRQTLRRLHQDFPIQTDSLVRACSTDTQVDLPHGFKNELLADGYPNAATRAVIASGCEDFDHGRIWFSPLATDPVDVPF